MEPRRRALLGAATAMSLTLVAVAERDLAHRPESELNGPKTLWRVLCLNALGALGYFRWGRRSTGAS